MYNGIALTNRVCVIAESDYVCVPANAFPLNVLLLNKLHGNTR